MEPCRLTLRVDTFSMGQWKINETLSLLIWIHGVKELSVCWVKIAGQCGDHLDNDPVQGSWEPTTVAMVGVTKGFQRIGRCHQQSWRIAFWAHMKYINLCKNLLFVHHLFHLVCSLKHWNYNLFTMRHQTGTSSQSLGQRLTHGLCATNINWMNECILLIIAWNSWKKVSITFWLLIIFFCIKNLKVDLCYLWQLPSWVAKIDLVCLLFFFRADRTGAQRGCVTLWWHIAGHICSPVWLTLQLEPCPHLPASSH